MSDPQEPSAPSQPAEDHPAGAEPRAAPTPIPADVPAEKAPRSRLRVLITVVCIILAVAILIAAAGPLYRLCFPSYTATALLAVEPPATTLFTDPPILDLPTMERYKLTQAALVKHQSVLEDAARDERITAKRWYAKHRGDIIQALDEAIMVAPLPETSLLRLGMTGTNKEELADIVNAVADSFVRFSGQDARQEIEGNIRKLQAESNDLKSQFERIRRDVAGARGASALAAMSPDRNVVGIKLENLTRRVLEAETRQARAQAVWQMLQKMQADASLAGSPAVRSILAADEEYKTLCAERARLEVRLLEAEAGLPGAGDVQKTRKAVEAVGHKVEELRKRLVKQAVDDLLQARQMELAATTQQLADLTDRLNRVKTQARDLEVVRGRIDALSKGAAFIEQNIQRIDRRLCELRALVRRTPGDPFPGAGLGPVRVAGYADVPRE